MRMTSVAIVGVVLLVPLRGAAGQSASAVTAERVTVPSGTLRLTGLLWKPTGSAPFPAVLFHHGAGPNDTARAEVLGPVFVVPGRALSAELTRLKRPHELKIYPAVGDTPQTGHWAVYLDVATWEPDVFRFLDTHLSVRRTR